jgi:hypothetical protein
MNRGTVRVVAAATVSILGLYVHNVADLPGQTVLSPETALPGAVMLVGLLVYFVAAGHVGAWLLLVWGWLQLIGGAASVLPLPFLPFSPEQSPRHYAFHVLYGVAQVPLIIVAHRSVRPAGDRGS